MRHNLRERPTWHQLKGQPNIVVKFSSIFFYWLIKWNESCSTGVYVLKIYLLRFSTFRNVSFKLQIMLKARKNYTSSKFSKVIELLKKSLRFYHFILLCSNICDISYWTNKFEFNFKNYLAYNLLVRIDLAYYSRTT